FRQGASKARIALELLDEARASGLAASGVIAAPSYENAEEFRSGLDERRLQLMTAASELAADADDGAALGNNLSRVEADYDRMKNELGLDHFEGRSWRGLHHHL